MKKKYIAVAVGLMISIYPMSIYAEEGKGGAATDITNAGKEGGEPADQEAVGAAEILMGNVIEVGEDSITISTGMQGGGQPPEGMPQNGEQPPEEAPGQEEQLSEEMSGQEEQPPEEMSGQEGQPSEEMSGQEEQPSEEMSEQGETVSIIITDETQIQKQSMGMPGGGQPGAMGGEVPEKPEGEMPVGEVPEKPEEDASDETMNGEEPDGGMPAGEMNGEMPEKPEGDTSGEMTEEISLSDIQEGDMVMIIRNEDGTAASVVVQTLSQGAGDMGPGGGMGQGSGVDSYEAVQTIEEDTSIEGETITSTGTDENAVLVDKDAEVSLEDVTVSRESSDSTGGDNSSFYGVGAALLATDGTLYVSDSTITTDASGGAGVFAYGDGTAYVADTDITTRQDTSGGIHAAGGGTLYAWNVTAETNGRSAAAVRSDRGGGTMVVDGGSYTSNGADSPAVYCTADISINDAELVSNGSEAVCIEGLNTLRLYNCDLTGNMSDDERNDNTWTVIVYQSMSGDSEVGNGTFQMDGGTLTSGNGGLFYTTNTECTITLKDVEIISSDDSEFFLQCTGNNNTRGWGQSGSNGSDCLFTAVSQAMQGDVVWDSISDLEFYMTEGSTLTGAFVNDETYAGNGGDGACNVYISEDSSWVVTGDSTVSALNCAGSIVDENGNTVTVQGEDGTVYVEGDSEYTVTAESYSGSPDLSGCSEMDTWEAHAAERPEKL